MVIPITQAISDPNLFGPWFKTQNTWTNWKVFLKAVFGEKMTNAEFDIFQEYTDREKAPSSQVDDAWIVVGRRGGKTIQLALIATYLACFRDWRPFLVPGEYATIMVIASDKKQARVCLRYIKAFLEEIPMLKKKVIVPRSTSIELANKVEIEIHTASFRATRGYTIVAALLDEIAFWRNEDNSLNPDYEIVEAIRPAMITVPGSLLLCASSPHSRNGVLWTTYKDYYGKDDDKTLVWKADTKTMNPNMANSPVITKAYNRDPAHADAEYGANFRTDIDNFVPREIADACIDEGIYIREFDPGTSYIAFVDPSGGSRDSMTLAIAHYDLVTNRAILDVMVEQMAPFEPSNVVNLFAKVLKDYNCATVYGDRFGGQWPIEAFLNKGVIYRVTDMSKSQIYLELLPELFNANVLLLDIQRLTNQLCSLERRTARGGRDTIDHPPKGHDDIINAAAGALVLAIQGGSLVLDVAGVKVGTLLETIVPDF